MSVDFYLERFASGKGRHVHVVVCVLLGPVGERHCSATA